MLYIGVEAVDCCACSCNRTVRGLKREVRLPLDVHPEHVEQMPQLSDQHVEHMSIVLDRIPNDEAREQANPDNVPHDSVCSAQTRAPDCPTIVAPGGTVDMGW